jgi:hypothetical protein
MDHYTRFEEKQQWITAKAESQIASIRAHHRDLLRTMAAPDTKYYRESLENGIHVSCEEIARRSKRLIMYAHRLQHIEDCKVGYLKAAMACYIQKERKKYEERTWKCADDGRAHLFLYRKRIYYRTFDGAVWKANEGKLGAWMGFWNGLYISKGEQPQRPIWCCQ